MAQTQAEEIAAFQADFMPKAPANMPAVFGEFVTKVRETGIEASGVVAGAQAPDFTVTDSQGQPVVLSELRKAGPVVLTFYRGGWCPYCNIALRHMAKVVPELKELGATVVALAPEKPEAVAETAKKNEVPFAVAHDAGQAVAKAYGLVFDFTEGLKELYKGFGLDVPAVNGSEEWQLPLAATFVIGKDGKVASAFRQVDYSKRKDPREVVEEVRALVATKTA
jgi:peroxiredoxin